MTVLAGERVVQNEIAFGSIVAHCNLFPAVASRFPSEWAENAVQTRDESSERPSWQSDSYWVRKEERNWIGLVGRIIRER
jgi:hypothetical protein